MPRCLALLGILSAKGGIQLILFDSRRRVAEFIEILLFGAIAHHAGMGNIRFLVGVLGNQGYIRHIKYSGAAALELSAVRGVRFRTYWAANAYCRLQDQIRPSSASTTTMINIVPRIPTPP